MSIPLHTGTRAVTVSSEWMVWDARCRLVVTDPWAMHRARELLEEEFTAIDRALRPRRRARRAVHGDGPLRVPDAALAGLFGPGAAARSAQPAPFPYGLAAASPDAEVHHPAPGRAQLALDAATARRDGMWVEPEPSLRARVAQRCAERVAEEMSCGALVAFGGDIATSGLAPSGGWRVELRDGPDAPSSVVAVDGGAICRLSPLRRMRGRAAPCPVVVAATGRTVVPVWRSVTVAAADAPAASAACASALLRGEAAPGWLAGRGLPALLVAADGAAHAVGNWPLPH